MNVLLQAVNKHESLMPLKIFSIWYRGTKRWLITNLSTSCSAGIGIALRLFVIVLP